MSLLVAGVKTLSAATILAGVGILTEHLLPWLGAGVLHGPTSLAGAGICSGAYFPGEGASFSLGAGFSRFSSSSFLGFSLGLPAGMGSGLRSGISGPPGISLAFSGTSACRPHSGAAGA